MMASAAKRTAPAHGTYLRRAAPRCRTRLAAERDVLFQIPCRRLGHRLDAFGNVQVSHYVLHPPVRFMPASKQIPTPLCEGMRGDIEAHDLRHDPRGIGPVCARRLVRAFRGKVFDLNEAESERDTDQCRIRTANSATAVGLALTLFVTALRPDPSDAGSNADMSRPDID